MQDAPYFHLGTHHGAGPCGSELAHPQHNRRPDITGNFLQGAVTDLKQGFTFLGRQPVRSAVASGFLQECQGTVIPHEKPGEKRLRRSKTILRPPPQPLTAHLAAPAVEALDGTLGMLGSRAVYSIPYAQPVPHQRYLPERHARLRHTPGSWIHPQQENLCSRTAIPVEVFAMCFSGVDQRIVDMGHRRPEAQVIHGPSQSPGDIAWIFRHAVPVPEFHPAIERL